jgi:V8-like Glu-specific endopeptidase
LLSITIDTFADDGWQEKEVSYLAISVLLPMNKMSMTEKDGLWEQWSHSEKDLRVTFNDLTALDLVNVHRDHANRSDRTGEPYTVRQPDRWVTSVKNNWGTGYIRSELIDGTWSTVAIYAANAHRAELGVISGGIKVGRPSSIAPESDGLLLSYASELAAAIAADEASKQNTDGNGRVGVSQPPQGDRREATQANSSGTGFFINSEGAMLTNAHVIEGCQAVTVDGKPADIVTVSQTFDLAVVKPRHVEDVSYLSFARTEAGLNADITIAGYPLHGLLGGLNVSRGSVSSMKGLGGDETSVQISAPVQPGNSGGPVIDRSGNIVGVVVSKLDTVLLADATGDIAQNVNFAIRGSMAKIFLQTNGISFDERDTAEDIRPEQAATTLQAATRLIQCVSD